MKGEKMSPILFSRIRNWGKQNLANSITLGRLIIAIWFLLTAVKSPELLWLIDILAVISAVADGIDGKIAERYGESLFGSILDRITDHVFIYPAFIILIWHHRWKLTKLPFYMDYLTTALGILMLAIAGLIFVAGFVGAYYHYIKRKGVDLHPNKWGQRKTGCGFVIVLLWLFSLTIEKYQGFPLIKFSVFLIDLGLMLMIYWAWKSLENYYIKGIEEIKAQQ